MPSRSRTPKRSASPKAAPKAKRDLSVNSRKKVDAMAAELESTTKSTTATSRTTSAARGPSAVAKSPSKGRQPSAAATEPAAKSGGFFAEEERVYSRSTTRLLNDLAGYLVILFGVVYFVVCGYFLYRETYFNITPAGAASAGIKAPTPKI